MIVYLIIDIWYSSWDHGSSKGRIPNRWQPCYLLYNIFSLLLNQEHDVPEYSALWPPVYALLPHRSIRRIPVLLEFLGHPPVGIEGKSVWNRHRHDFSRPSCNLESLCALFRDRIFQKSSFPLDLLYFKWIGCSSPRFSSWSCRLVSLIAFSSSCLLCLPRPSFLPCSVISRVIVFMAVEVSLLGLLSFLDWCLDDNKIFRKAWFCLKLGGGLASLLFLR